MSVRETARGTAFTSVTALTVTALTVTVLAMMLGTLTACGQKGPLYLPDEGNVVIKPAVSEDEPRKTNTPGSPTPDPAP